MLENKLCLKMEHRSIVHYCALSFCDCSLLHLGQKCCACQNDLWLIDPVTMVQKDTLYQFMQVYTLGLNVFF